MNFVPTLLWFKFGLRASIIHSILVITSSIVNLTRLSACVSILELFFCPNFTMNFVPTLLWFKFGLRASIIRSILVITSTIVNLTLLSACVSILELFFCPNFTTNFVPTLIGFKFNITRASYALYIGGFIINFPVSSKLLDFFHVFTIKV